MVGGLGLTSSRKLESAYLYVAELLMHGFLANTKTKTGQDVLRSTIERNLYGTYFELDVGGSFKVGKGSIYRSIHSTLPTH